MVSSKAQTVKQYLDELPTERHEAISKVRQVILKNLAAGFEEGMQYGMIGYYIPLKDFPNTYNGQPIGIAALASQKNYISIYLMNIYSDKKTSEWFESEYKKSGKKMNKGKCCVRFKKLDDLPLELIGKAIARTTAQQFIEQYKKSRKIGVK